MLEADEHLSFNQLIDLANNRLAADHDEVAEHLAACPTCATEFVLSQRLITALAVGVIEPPSPQAVARVQALFRARRPAGHALVGTLLFDSRTARPAGGFRSASMVDQQLLFLAEDTTVDLRVEAADKQWLVSGQVLGPVTHGIVILADTAVVAQAVLTELAEFILPPVAVGVYNLTVLLDERAIMIPGLSIGGN